jgi:hypothetical protein
MNTGSKRYGMATLNRIEARILSLNEGAPTGNQVWSEPKRRFIQAVRPFPMVITCLALLIALVAPSDHERSILSLEPEQLPWESGSGRVAVQVTSGDTLLRVSIHSSLTPAGPWFWCFDSDRGLRLDQRYCASDGVHNPKTGDVTTTTVLHLEPGAVTGAKFFVQTFCPNPCTWRASATPASPAVTAAGK